MSTVPMSWIHRIHHTLQEMKEIPLWGNVPTFPWDKCVKEIAPLLQTPELSLVVGDTQLLKEGHIASGLGNYPIMTAIQLTPLVGQCFWIMAQEDISFLISLALTEDQNQKASASVSFQEGFYRFLLLEMIKAIDPVQPFHGLSIKMGSLTTVLPKEDCICIDIGMHHPKKVLWGRIACPLSFHQTFKAHFANTTFSIDASSVSKDVDVSISANIGHTQLKVSQWEKIAVGDFLLLDACSYSPDTAKGTATLFLEHTPLFTVICKPTNCKIIDYAYQEEYMDSEEEKDFAQEDDDDIDLEQDNDADLEQEEKADFAQEKLTSIADTPLTIHVEIARKRMNLKKILQLKPGNVIELAARPEQGVNLTVNGKIIAHAELVQLGDTLGVKILQIGE